MIRRLSGGADTQAVGKVCVSLLTALVQASYDVRYRQRFAQAFHDTPVVRRALTPRIKAVMPTGVRSADPNSAIFKFYHSLERLCPLTRELTAPSRDIWIERGASQARQSVTDKSSRNANGRISLGVHPIYCKQT